MHRTSRVFAPGRWRAPGVGGLPAELRLRLDRRAVARGDGADAPAGRAPGAT
jgi:hypothetical protein